MLNHVLIPLDGSCLAEATIEEARRVMLADAQITLLTVVQEPSALIYGLDFTGSSSSSYRAKVKEVIAEAKRYLQKMAKKLRTDNFKVSLRVKFGDDAACMIVETAQQLQVDAIVMSTHGHSGINRWLFGSVAEKVLSTACCPVLVIPSREMERIRADQATENYIG